MSSFALVSARGKRKRSFGGKPLTSAPRPSTWSARAKALCEPAATPSSAATAVRNASSTFASALSVIGRRPATYASRAVVELVDNEFPYLSCNTGLFLLANFLSRHAVRFEISGDQTHGLQPSSLCPTWHCEKKAILSEDRVFRNGADPRDVFR